MAIPFSAAAACRLSVVAPPAAPSQRPRRGMLAVRAEAGARINPAIRKEEDKVVDTVLAGELTKPLTACCRYQVKNTRGRPVFALETGVSPNSDGQDSEEDTGFLGRTRLGRLIQAAARELLEKLNSGRTNSPTKAFLVLLGFYTANALSTILGQTGDWDVLVAAVIVATIELIGMLVYIKPVARSPRTGRFQSLISMMNYWKGGVCLGLFVDAFKVGS